MFRAFRSSRTASRLLLVAALAGITAGAFGAEPDGWKKGRRWQDSDRCDDGSSFVIRLGRRPIPSHHVVVSQPQPVVCHDEVPLELQISAYQSQDRVIILVSGCNRSGGYSTGLASLNLHCDTPELLLRNTAPACHTTGPSRFTLNAAICSPRPLHCLKVRVAGTVIEVPVICVQSIS